MKRCCKCGGNGILITTYDREQVICEDCEIRTEIELGDYYDEAFMDGRYVIPKWNRGDVSYSHPILKEEKFS